MITISQVNGDADIADVRDLIREYTGWAFTLMVAQEVPPTFEGLEEELAGLPGVFVPPAGRLLLARVDGQPAGCSALKPVDAATGELKRFFVRPSFRGLALGQQLVAAIVQAGSRAGYQRLILDSHATMTHAHALYRAAGFRLVEAPPDFPEAIKPEVVFMELIFNR
jgi:GNAT superfamily N-acetyltransferase